MNWKCFFLGHVDSLVPIENKKWYFNPGCKRCKKRYSTVEWLEKKKGEWTKIQELQDMKYVNLCYKCSIGRHSQHSTFLGKGKTHFIYPEGYQREIKRGEVCECPRCFDPDLY